MTRPERMSAIMGWAAACIVALSAGQSPANAGTGVETILHSFNGSPVSGAHPCGNLALSSDGSTFYGMDHDGGAAGAGVVYAVGVSGAGYAVLHSFGGPALDGASPYGSLTLGGTTLYGMTYAGGASNTGVIFKMNTDGTGYQILHSFAGGTNDGANPIGSLTLSGSVLYGMTCGGGANNDGTVFSINTNGNGFALVHTFAGATDGAMPYGSLTLSGSMLYGMTPCGGANGCGVIFSLDTGNGNAFGLLHSFSGGDGEAPRGSLTLLNGTTLYGMTEQGGDNSCGTIFSIGANGTGFTTLRSFDWLSEGGFPAGDLGVNGSTLYGMTSQGGASQSGTMFSMDVSGSPFAVLHAFAGGAGDGAAPRGGLTLAGGTIYGTSANGGNIDNGTLFSISPTGTGFALLYPFTGSPSDGAQPQGSLKFSGGAFYGMTKSGGAFGLGAVFTREMDGTGYEILHSFSGGTADGATPYGNLTPNGSTLYGMTSQGGASNLGTIFTMNTDASGFTLLHTFVGGASDGAIPYGSLTLSPDGTMLYGMTFIGGAYNYGTLFRMKVDGTGFSILHSFLHDSATDGDSPLGSLTLSPDGATLYGMTYGGSAIGNGTVFKINANGSGFALLHSFTGSSGEGAFPQGSLTLIGSTLYGMTSTGGVIYYGSIFQVNTNGTGFATLYSFNGPTDGSFPLGDLTLSGTSTLYGMTSSGSSYNAGSVFTIDKSGSNFSVVYPFGGSVDDGQSPAGDVFLSGMTLYGLTSQGGTGNSGTVFQFNLQATLGNLTVTLSPAAAVSAGAQWSVDGGNTWYASAQTISLVPGNYTLTFSALGGWNSPASQRVTITDGATSTTTGIYVQVGPVAQLAFVQPPTNAEAGSTIVPPVTVAIEDANGNVVTSDSSSVTVAIGSGATGTGTLSGTLTMAAVNGVATFSDLSISAAGAYTLQATDGALKAATSAGFTISVQTGSLTVTLAPAAAVTAGAQWNVDSDAWQNGGAIVSGLAAGVSHTINYKAIAGWNSPPSASATITYNNTTTATGTYVEQTGSLTVTLAPAAAVTAGAQWRVDDGAWQSSGNTVTGLLATFHTVDYLQIPGWAPPPIESVAIFDTQTVTLARIYVADNTPPAVSCEYPAPSDTYLDPLASIKLRVNDAGSGVDLSTVQITASRDGGTRSEVICNGANLTPAAPTGDSAAAYLGCYDATANGNTVFKGRTYIGGAAPSYVFLFEPDTDAAFGFDETVTVSVSASDRAGNAMTPSSSSTPPSLYSFTIAPRNFGCNLQVDDGTPGDAFPATATDATGNVWVAWERNADGTTTEGSILLAERQDPIGDCDFGREIAVTSFAENGDCHKPAIAIAANGTICLAYEVHAADPSNNVITVSSATTASPTVWSSSPGSVTGATFTLRASPVITYVNSANTLCVAGVGADSGGVQQIGIATLASGATSWTVTPITSGGADKSSPAIAHDANGVVYVVWADTGDNNLYGADSFSAWTIHQVTNTSHAGSPGIATETTGNVLHFVWATNAATPDIQYADTAAGGGWPATSLTTGASVLNGSGITNAANPRILVTGTFSPSVNAQVFVVWQGSLSTVPGDTDIWFSEMMWNGQFYPMPVLVSIVPAGLGLAADAAHNPALGMRLDGMPYVAWTDLREAGASHIYFSEAMGPPCLPPPSPIVTNPGGTVSGAPMKFIFADNPHFKEVDVSVPSDAFGTSISIMVNELTNPVVECPGGAGIIAAMGTGLYLDITGGSGCGGTDSDDDALGDWITVTIHLTSSGATLTPPLAVYRLVPPTLSSLGAYSWTTDLVRNVSYDSNANTLTFQTMHLSSFGVGAGSASGGGSVVSSSSGGGGCAMSRGADPDIFVLLLPPAALGFWCATRLIGRKRRAKARDR